MHFWDIPNLAEWLAPNLLLFNPMMRPFLLIKLVKDGGAWNISLRWLIYAVMLIALPALAGNSVSLAWNPSVGINVAGYKIYYGVASQTYTNSIDVGKVTSAAISGFTGGTTYYFAATSYDVNGVESGFSNEAILTVLPPTAPVLTSTSYVNGRFTIGVSGVTNQCVVQASSNLVDWVSVQTNSAPFTFVDPNSSQFIQRFYRTYYLP
jgi:hypothetical protein